MYQLADAAERSQVAHIEAHHEPVIVFLMSIDLQHDLVHANCAAHLMKLYEVEGAVRAIHGVVLVQQVGVNVTARLRLECLLASDALV